MTDSTGTTDFVLDGSMVVRDKKNGVYTATYLTGPRGIEYRKDDSTGAVSWYLYDGLGSVIAEVDNTGTITATNQNDVYGITLSSSGTGTTDHKFVGKLGHTTEPNTGLIYMRARYYDPALGRFISQDPAKDSVNWYAYCDNNPINQTDDGGRAGKAVDIVTQTFCVTFMMAFWAQWGEALALGDIDLESLARKSGLSGLKACFQVGLPVTAYFLLTKSEGPMTRIALRIGYEKGSALLSGASLAAGLGWGCIVAAYMGARSGQIAFETNRALYDF